MLPLILVCGMLSAFQCNQADPSEQTQVTPDTAVNGNVEMQHELPERIILGAGGGFTGRWEGFIIEQDGSVWSWSGYGAPSDTNFVGRLPADSLQILARLVPDSGFYADSTSETGNMTAFLEIMRGGDAHRVSWIPSVEGVEPPKSPTEALYRRARAMAASAGSG